jgi:hypothetical protein
MNVLVGALCMPVDAVKPAVDAPARLATAVGASTSCPCSAAPAKDWRPCEADRRAASIIAPTAIASAGCTAVTTEVLA